jgi:transposase
MAWKDLSVSEQRMLLVNLIEHGGESVAAVCRRLGVSRKTAYKWLARSRDKPGAPLTDRPRRPLTSPAKTKAAVEKRVVALHDKWRCGARKIRKMLLKKGRVMPSINTLNRVLRRHGRVAARPAPEPPATQRFERGGPNELWQLDHKGPLEIGRCKRHPLTVMDDHSRYLLMIEPCEDLTVTRVWALLWSLFGDVGLPDAILCDNAFAVRQAMPGTLTRFEANLIRLNIEPIHGRPYHPQTQGKVERMHGTYEREMYKIVRTDSDEHFRADSSRWRQFFNRVRPHEALGDEPPMTRWRPSERRRPRELPPVIYDAGALLRTVGRHGDVNFSGKRIIVGEGLAGDQVRLEEGDVTMRVYYAKRQVRTILLDALARANGKRVV